MNFTHILRKFSIHTTQGRVVTLSASFLTVFVVFAGFVYRQNKKTEDVSQMTIEVRLPVALSAANVLSNIEAAATAQLTFILTKDQKYVDQRQQIWKDRINPELAKLVQLKPVLPTDEQLKVDSISAWIKGYHTTQEEENSITLQLQKLDMTDSTSIALQQIGTARLAVLVPQISNYYSKIERELTILSQHQQEQLGKEVADILQSINATNSTIASLCAIIVVLAIIIGYYASQKASSAIEQTTYQIQSLAKGEIAESIAEVKGDMNVIVQAGNQLKDNLRNAVSFALAVGEGKFNTSFTPVSEKDALGNALLFMRDKLQLAAEEDRKRNWTTEGLAKFADILRSTNDFKELSTLIISNLVKYINANQGGLFIVQKEDTQEPVLELAACYAYNRKKYLTKQILIGEGLVGQCYQEGDSIYLTDLPNDYIHISSGLGTARPTCLLIVPLKVNDAIEGVIELASFQEITLHERAFIEKLGENIASTLSAAKLNAKTQKLLEETKQQAEIMRSQEEEMRQNMEELMATQEEMERRQWKNTDYYAQNAE
ncbi:GAF domain-containing protein [Xanthocytophaga agilis]|uniref:GAF domain-containing protein n=1 Tax=Xanthocytophaga agilis TaxID=3048010 RepID=A0AAE3R9K6_9BACT|nr:GAF domain-containing protein [Xanthocytophaga agilis]MDJ1503994.1 GAF domain-containing protein [Xanthocytophaga agilis]